MSRALLVAVASGDPIAGELATRLAEAVLGAPATRLAAAVLAGGPHALDRAIELAGLCLSDTNVEPDERRSSA